MRLIRLNYNNRRLPVLLKALKSLHSPTIEMYGRAPQLDGESEDDKLPYYLLAAKIAAELNSQVK